MCQVKEVCILRQADKQNRIQYTKTKVCQKNTVLGNQKKESQQNFKESNKQERVELAARAHVFITFLQNCQEGRNRECLHCVWVQHGQGYLESASHVDTYTCMHRLAHTNRQLLPTGSFHRSQRLNNLQQAQEKNKANMNEQEA